MSERCDQILPDGSRCRASKNLVRTWHPYRLCPRHAVVEYRYQRHQGQVVVMTDEPSEAGAELAQDALWSAKVTRGLQQIKEGRSRPIDEMFAAIEEQGAER